jgi:hypothetical protein
VVTSDLLISLEYFVKEGAAAHVLKPIVWNQLKDEIHLSIG